jgi:putative ABC transport system substrate-binding protein
LGAQILRFSCNALREGLQKLGYSEGKNIRLEFRSAHGKINELPNLAAGLVGLKVDVIVTLHTPALVAAAQATTDIPIVMGTGDPFSTGLAASHNRPGGNVTGVIQGILETLGKNIELIHELLPSARRIAVLERFRPNMGQAS